MFNTSLYSHKFARTIAVLFAILLIDFWQCIPAIAQTAPPIIWQQTIGGGSYDQINYVDLTSDGGYILGGYSSSGISGDKTEACFGNHDYWAIKVDAAGAIEWQNTIGSNDVDGLLVNHQTADGGYILMGFSHSGISADKSESNIGYQDYWVVKLKSTGAIEWENTIGGNGGDGGRCLVELSDGGFIIGGFSYSSVSYDQTHASSGVSDYWVLKINSTGIIEWQNTIGGNGYDWMQSVQPTTNGGYIIGGWSDSGISGDKTKASKGGTDYWVVKINSTGSIEWQNVIGGSSDESLSVILQTSDGGYVLGGTSKSGISGDKTEASLGLNDYWIVKLNEEGSIDWQNTIGGNNEEYFTTIQLTPDGGYIIGGSSSSGISGDKTTASWGGFDYWLLKLSESGAIEWQKTIGGNNDDNLSSIQVTGNESYILGGGSASGISGDKTSASQGDFDFWLVKLGCEGINVYGDVDGDGFGNAADSFFVEDCIAPVGYASDSSDCNDNNSEVNPDAIEVSNNGIDDDCDGNIDESGTNIFSAVNTTSVFALFPNPTNGKFEVHLQLQNEPNGDAKIEVINLLGQVIYNKSSVLVKGKLQESIKLNDAADAIYLVRVMVKDEAYYRQIVYQK